MCVIVPKGDFPEWDNGRLAGVDMLGSRKNLKPRVREMLDAKRAARRPYGRHFPESSARHSMLGAFIAISVCVNFGHCQELELCWKELR